MRKRWLLLTLVLGVLLVLSVAVGSATASPGILYVKPSASGSGTCSNWANACTLQTALGAAGDGDEIWVAEGTHKPTTGTDRTATFQLVNGVEAYGGFAGTETSRDQRDWFVCETVLSGDIGTVGDDSDNSYHVIVGSGTDATAMLDGFTVSGGYADGSYPDCVGGGMYNAAASPTLTNVSFSDNYADFAGGGMYNEESSPTLTDVVFSDNSAESGGGMYNEESSPALTSVAFSGNSALEGGGMSSYSDSSPTLTDVSFSDNHVSHYGGGIYNWQSSLTLTNGIVNGNSAKDEGGGIWNFQTSPTLTNVVFSGNSATRVGGGMLSWGGSNPVLTNVSFSGNSAGSKGGGMMNYSSLTLTNAILWSNSAPNGPQIYNDSITPTISYSLVQGSGGTGPGWDTGLGTDGGGNIDADPQFVDADGPDNMVGTLDDNLRLWFTSPAIDAGDNSGVPTDTLDMDGDGNITETLPFDLDGYPRFLDVLFVPDTGAGLPPIVDMGAYEAQKVARVCAPLALKNYGP